MINDLRQARMRSGYTIKEVSEIVKISTKSLSRYENQPGKTPVDVFIKLHSIYKSSICPNRKDLH